MIYCTDVHSGFGKSKNNFNLSFLYLNILFQGSRSWKTFGEGFRLMIVNIMLTA